MEFTCVDEATGKVLFGGVCDDPSPLQEPGRLVIEEAAPPDTYRHEGAWVAIPVRPSLNHQWNWTTKVWEDPRTLEEHKAARKQVIKRSRDEFINGGFTWDGSTFDSNTISQLRLSGVHAKSLREPGMSETWRLADNSWRTLNATDVGGVYQALEDHIRSAFQTQALLESQIDSAVDQAEVEAVIWPTP